MSDFVTVHQTYSPVEADMLGDVLRSEGIAARVLGTRYGSTIGAGEHVCQVRVEVRAACLDRATELVKSIVNANEDPLEEQSAEEEEDGDDTEPAPLRWMLAVGCSFAVIIPAAGHLYARRRWVWLVLLGAWVWSLVQALQHEWSSACVGLVGLGLVLIADIFGGVVGVRLYNQGARPGRLRQLVYGTAIAASVIGAASMIGPHLPEPQPDVTHMPVYFEDPLYEDFSGLSPGYDIEHLLEDMQTLSTSWAVPEEGLEMPADAGTTE